MLGAVNNLHPISVTLLQVQFVKNDRVTNRSDASERTAAAADDDNDDL